jgi:thioredoxin 1
MVDVVAKGCSVVKFGAEWCAPCKRMATIIKKVLSEFENVKLQEVDVDDDPVAAKDYKIRSVPTVILTRDGQEVNRLVGLTQTEALRKALRDLVKEKAA